MSDSERPVLPVAVPTEPLTLAQVLARVIQHVRTDPGRCSSGGLCVYRNVRRTNACFVGLFIPDTPEFAKARNHYGPWLTLSEWHPEVKKLFAADMDGTAMSMLQACHDDQSHWTGGVFNWAGGAALQRWASRWGVEWIY